jgi:hypothetical protein
MLRTTYDNQAIGKMCEQGGKLWRKEFGVSFSETNHDEQNCGPGVVSGKLPTHVDVQ